MAICGLASLASLGLAATGWARSGGGVQPAGAGWERAAGAGSATGRDRAPLLRLARSGENPFFSFLEGLFGGEQRSAPRRSQRRPRPVPRPEPVPAPAHDQPEPPATYRTMCVRLCDGYYWPISFATPETSFARDAMTCDKSCRASVALYYYPNPGGEVEEMVSLEGRPYKSLGTAFLYRTVYDPHCKCRPHPWEAEAAARHESYAEPSGVRAAARRARRQP